MTIDNVYMYIIEIAISKLRIKSKDKNQSIAL